MKIKCIGLFLMVFVANFAIMANKKSTKNQPKLPWLDTLIANGKYGNNPIVDIKSYTYKNKIVFLVNYDAGCCDQYSAVLKDENGNTICHPFGGISGKGDMQCADFMTIRFYEKLIWQNDHPILVTEKKEKSFKMEKH